MFMSEVNYKSIESSPPDEVSYSDVENVALSPDGSRIDVINVEQSSIDGRSSSKGVRGDDGRSWTMAKVQVGYDVTRKGERSLVVDGFKFTKSRDGTNYRIFWRCSRRECKATAVTVCDRVEHVRAIHAHEPPLAAEFFGSHEGAVQNCELQEVRFNTNAANMRPRYRRANASLSESNTEESTLVKDISNSTNNNHNNSTISEQRKCSTNSDNAFQSKMQTVDIKPTSLMMAHSQQKSTNSVKDQVREFILRNTNQINNCPPNSGVSVAQFLISPAAQSPFLNTANSVGASPSCNSSTVFNFNPMHISASSNNGSDSTSDISSQKSTPAMINVPTTPRNESPLKTKSVADAVAMNQVQIEQIIQMLLKSGANRQRSSSESEWSSPTPGPGLPQFDLPPNSPSMVISAGVPYGYQASAPSRFVHWKKEKLRESEICDQMHNDRKRRHDDCYHDFQGEHVVNTTSCTQSPATDSKQLATLMHSLRLTMTRKLLAVMQKLASQLCPEQAVAQDVFEKCTAIKTCLETLEKLHSMAAS